MSRFIPCVVFFICTCCVFADLLGTGSALHRERRRITTLPPTFDCNKADFKDYNKKCCTVNPGDLFSANDIKNCNKPPTPDNVKYVQDYYMNKFQDKAKNNAVNFTDKNLLKTIAKPACLVDCLFKNLNFTNPETGDFNIDAMNVYFLAQTPTEWDPIVGEIVGACSSLASYVPKLNVTTDERPPRTCSVTPLLIMQCVRWYMIGACPESKEPTNPPSQCAAGSNAQDNCLIYKIPSSRR